jgi:hypothetical protein
MRQSDIETIAEVIIASGIATRTQRQAIAQRVRDWFAERKAQKE